MIMDTGTTSVVPGTGTMIGMTIGIIVGTGDTRTSGVVQGRGNSCRGENVPLNSG